MPEEKDKNGFRFEIKTHVGVLSENKSGWSKELNVVSWNGRRGKYDIREWDPDHKKMSRGITMTDEEFDELTKLISAGVREDAELDTDVSGEAAEPSEEDEAEPEKLSA